MAKRHAHNSPRYVHPPSSKGTVLSNTWDERENSRKITQKLHKVVVQEIQGYDVMA